MKKALRVLGCVAAGLFTTLLSGCDDKWEKGGDFNTSQGAGINVNFSGVYTARAGGAIIPEGDDGEAEITRLIITQIGNTIEVRDDYNKLYTGYVGSPGVMDSGGGSYPAGATLLQAQVNFTNNKNVDFVGIIRAVAVTDITSSQIDTTSTEGQLTNITVTVSETIGSETTEVEIGDTSETETTTTRGRTYNITEANSQYVLQGNWVRHHFDDVIGVDAFSRSLRGQF